MANPKLPTALDQLLVKQVAVAGVLLPSEPVLNLLSGATAVDNPAFEVNGQAVGSTDVTIAGGGGASPTLYTASGGAASIAVAVSTEAICFFSGLTANGAVTLPAAPGTGQKVRVAILDASGLAFAVAVSGNGKTIGAASASTHSVYGGGVSVDYTYDGTKWWVTNKSEPRKPPIDGNTVIQWPLNEPVGASSWANSGTAGTYPIGSEVLYGTVHPRGGPVPAGLDFSLAEIGTAEPTSTGESSGDFTLIAFLNKRSDPSVAAQAHIVGKRHAANTAWAAPQISVGIAMQGTSSAGTWRTYFTQVGGSLDNLDSVAPQSVFADAEPCMVSLRFTKSTGRFDMHLCGDLSASKVGTMGAGVAIDWGTHGAWYMGGIATGNTQCFDGILADVRVLQVAASDTYLKTLWAQWSGQLNIAV